MEPWLCKLSILTQMQSQFELMEQILGKFPETQSFDALHLDNKQRALSLLQSNLRNQMSDLADAFLGAFTDRLGYLKKVDTMDAHQEAESLLAEYNRVRPKVIFPLVKHGRKTNAFLIAEKYLDFSILAQLSLDDVNRESRIDDYMHRYSFDFARVLFSIYLEKGLLLMCTEIRNVQGVTGAKT